MRVRDIEWVIGWKALREPDPSMDKYRWKKGYRLIRGKVWFGKEDGETIARTERGERIDASASAVFIKDKPIGIGWGVCVSVESGESCDYRITKLADRGAYWRAELTGIPPEFRG
ncbi:MAG: hypothetical protein LBK46_06840 [Oscillospiraceae bacterium]|jgi:hypothetical protein|nr:hypothetical protein [Oscillospiraceae bacterium]